MYAAFHMLGMRRTQSFLCLEVLFEIYKQDKFVVTRVQNTLTVGKYYSDSWVAEPNSIKCTSW